MGQLFFLVCLKFWQVFYFAIAFVGIIPFGKIKLREVFEELLAKFPFSNIA